MMAQSERERVTLSPPSGFPPWLIVLLPSAFSGDSKSLPSIHAQPAPLSLPLSSSSTWPPPSSFPSIFLHDRLTRSDPPKDCHRTCSVGGEPDDTSGCSQLRSSSNAVVGGGRGAWWVAAETAFKCWSPATFNNVSWLKSIPLNLLFVMVRSIHDENVQIDDTISYKLMKLWQLIWAKRSLILR